MNTTILVVDDTLDLLDLYSIWLRQAGYQVLQASTGREGLRLVVEELPDLVLLDVMLPDVDGIEVCKIIKSNERTAAIPVINVSGMRTSADHEAEGLEAGADGYLTKPVSSRTLLAHIRALLRIKQTEEALKRSEERFRAAFDNALDAMVIADDNANYVDANPSACAMFGVTKEEMLRRKLSDFVDPARGPEVEKAWQVFLKEGEQSGDFHLTRLDGTTVELEYQAKAHFLPNRHLSVLRDVTRRKQIEEELRLAHTELEKRVEQRTTELVAANSFLKNEITQHKLTEQALRESEEHIRLMVDGIKDYAIFMLDTEGRIASWNEGAGRLKGYRSDEIIGKPHSICFTPEDIREGKPELALKVAAAEGRNEDEYWIVRKDKSRFWANVIITALRDDEGNLRGFVEITGDITERKRVEDALRQSEEQYRELVENINDIIYATDAKGVVTYASPAMQSTGYKLHEVIGHPFSEFVYPEDVPLTMNSFQSSTFDHTKSLEVRLLTKTGGIRWMCKSSLPVFHGDRFAGTRGLLVDITERKEAERALRETNRTLHTLIQSSPLAIVGLDVQGNVQMWNPAAESIFGWSEQEVVGRVPPFITKAKMQEFRSLFQDSLKGKANHDVELLREKKDGSSIHVSLSTAPIGDDEEGITGVIGIMADITERKRVEAERFYLLRRLVTAQEEEQRRLSRELHDQTGQSLAALMLGLKAIEDSLQLNEIARGRLRQLQQLTNQLARDVHHLASNLRPTALDDLGLNTALANYVEEWSERTKIRADFHSNGLLKERLPIQIEIAVYRIVQEALTNVARHANAKNVSVILEYRGNRVQAIVEDDGCGFDTERSISASKGSGRLGLMGMQERLALVDGHLNIESSPDTGTTVIVHIPVSTGQSEANI